MNSASGYRIVAAGIIGNVLEWYDFAIYGYFAAAIRRHFFPHQDPVAQLLSSFGVFAVGYLMRPVGGALIGHIGDRFGRRRALTLSVAAMASTSPRHRRPSERVPTKTFSEMIHRLKEDVRSWYELHRRNGATNVVVWATYLELLLMLVLLVLLPFDTVQVGGRYRLIKPLNFTMSVAMYLATVVILLDYLRASMWWKKVIGWRVSICILTAITCITMQAARGTTSHFNNSTPFDSAVSSLMDIVDPLNSVFVLVLLIFAIQVKYDVSRSSQLGIAFGLFLFLAGSAIGGVMVAQGRSVAGVAPGGPGLPVLNWSTTGGDFRVAHFLGIHALQILPIVGWLIDRLKGLPRRAKPTAVVAVSAGYVLLMGFVFMQAMNGVPLVRM